MNKVALASEMMIALDTKKPPAVRKEVQPLIGVSFVVRGANFEILG